MRRPNIVCRRDRKVSVEHSRIANIPLDRALLIMGHSSLNKLLVGPVPAPSDEIKTSLPRKMDSL